MNGDGRVVDAEVTEDDATARTVLYSREGCHLCEEALAVVERVCAAVGESWAVVDVDSTQALRERYGEYVPVVEVDGVQQGFWRIDGERLVRALAR
ncbi:glutaredoxin family protein [Sanguibacter suaedae]|uniref:Glutaredoxin family protein n=1 Tax=Sanguibacter suaedae TaxID=2795737 RepID=A0A934MCK1_9MICO|nr:glutaredoxin family protein [Sanguibacter suaedae]MBI9113939.1 glutaredoxin family protein [Sanguibacter suaedae]